MRMWLWPTWRRQSNKYFQLFRWNTLFERWALSIQWVDFDTHEFLDFLGGNSATRTRNNFFWWIETVWSAQCWTMRRLQHTILLHVRLSWSSLQVIFFCTSKYRFCLKLHVEQRRHDKVTWARKAINNLFRFWYFAIQRGGCLGHWHHLFVARHTDIEFTWFWSSRTKVSAN